jgi:CubicO group peptidase (beta-lactamase class C family)
MMKTELLIATMVLSLVSCAPYAKKPELSGKIDALFQAYSQSSAPGACVSVIKDGQVLYSKGYGLANLEERLPVTTATNFRLASVTKQFTAMAIMMLADRGKLSFDDSMARVLPGTPAYLQGIRIRHLLNHTSGIVDYESLIPDSQTVQVLDRDVLALLSTIDTTYFPAGSKFQYSNSGYALLSLVVEALSHQSFAEFLKENIFDPLGMAHTLAYQQGISTVPNRAYGYSRADSGFVCTDQSVTSAVLGDGGVYSSVDDFFKWDQALYTEDLVRASTLQQALTPATLNDGSSTTYGFGWFIEPYRGVPTVYHTGSTRGFRNAILRFPGQRLTIIILTNRNEGEPVKIARSIADLILFEKTH